MHVNIDITHCHVSHACNYMLVTLNWQVTLPKWSNTFAIMPVRMSTLNTTQKYICKGDPATSRVVHFMQNMDNAQLLACFAFISTSLYVHFVLAKHPISSATFKLRGQVKWSESHFFFFLLTRGTSCLRKVPMLVGVSGTWATLIGVILSREESNIKKKK